MASNIEAIKAKARRLADVAQGRSEGDRAERLAERLAAGRFLVSVVGDFNRGKSTLINALLGEGVLPTGVLPLTAVSTEVAYGEPRTTVEHRDGSRVDIDPADLGDFVTEAGNPTNGRQVRRVEVRGRWPLLEPGVVLVDTPGIASVHRHNTEAARAALLDADGAVLVLSADTPLSEQERDVLRVLAERRAPTFHVLNKADHLAPAELDQVCRFVEDIVCDEVGRKTRVFAVSARGALTSARAGRPRAADGVEFDEFLAELERFVAEDLLAARVLTARRELARLGASLRDAVAVERAAAELDVATRARQVERFRAAATSERRAFDDDRTLLVRDVARLADGLWRRLHRFASATPDRFDVSLAEVAATAPRARLVDELRAAVESAVRTTFEGFREEESDRTERAWRATYAHVMPRDNDRVRSIVDATLGGSAEDRLRTEAS